jgi:hypothetical protein
MALKRVKNAGATPEMQDYPDDQAPPSEETTIIPDSQVLVDLSKPVEVFNPTAPENVSMKGLTPGRMVHYVSGGAYDRGQHLPAIIVEIHNSTMGVVSLQAFLNSSQGMRWVNQIRYSAEPEPDTWHWIEPA